MTICFAHHLLTTELLFYKKSHRCFIYQSLWWPVWRSQKRDLCPLVLVTDHSRGIYRHYVHQDLVIGLVVGLSLLAVLLIILILHAVTWKSQVSRFCYQR